MLLILLVDEIHSCRFDASLDVVALVALVIHWVLWQVVHTGSSVLHQELKFARYLTFLRLVPFVEGILGIADGHVIQKILIRTELVLIERILDNWLSLEQSSLRCKLLRVHIRVIV